MPSYVQRLGMYHLITQIYIFLAILCIQWLDKIEQVDDATKFIINSRNMKNIKLKKIEGHEIYVQN